MVLVLVSKNVLVLVFEKQYWPWCWSSEKSLGLGLGLEKGFSGCIGDCAYFFVAEILRAFFVSHFDLGFSFDPFNSDL